MSRAIFVPLATGQQGQALSKELLRRGYAVKSLTRNLQSPKAIELTKLGAELIEGQISSADDVHAALAGVDAVWLALPASLDEVGTGRAIIDAARSKGIKQFVYSSVARTGEHESFPGWSDSYPLSWYWTQKAALEDAVRGAGFESWTILRPAFFTQNSCRPVVDFLYPGLTTEHVLRVAYRPETRLDLVDTAGIASAGANAFDSPAKFHGKRLALGSEKLTAQEIADALGRITGHAIKVVYLNDDEVKEAQKLGPIVDSQVWHRDVGYNVDLAACRENNFKTSTMAEVLTKEQLGW
ncbi:hypothetical protein B0T11DRAFT_357270 [Plectosphaerella cucumerina]|jgi:uncharacterized protein YbjT (DUF2867 family)|uniref:NmrA-like domain-containing protein n=1 Tax=Plectosphaerella cucumerina TaxID=40658 RepID=A0A8K0X0E6_9PEZI|nr:hypothetical protein B0T11DRAFT_357270 [Plectosphaerella cucumerina]